MAFNSWHEFRTKAARAPKRIVLADGEDPRVIRAAAAAVSEQLAKPFLVGSRRKIEPLWKSLTSQPVGIVDLDEFSGTQRQSYLESLLRCPKFKKLTTAEAHERLKDTLVLGCLHSLMGESDGFIGGSLRTTADTLRAAFSTIGLAPHASTLFGFFFIERRSDSGAGPLVLLADCAVIPEPSPKQLAAIGIQAASAYEFFTGGKARVGFLSFSTHGSAEHPLVDRVRQAVTLARQSAPDLACEGEWQADAALDPFTAGIKGVGDSALAGQINVLITPDLNTGNIAYKLVQRLGGCRAVGPVLWGMAKPANDLSRGCSTEDVLDMIALTVLEAQRAAQPAVTTKSH